MEEFQNVSANNVFVSTKTDLEAIDVSETDRLLGLFSPTHMIFDHERRNKLVDFIPDSPSISDMTKKAIEMLSKNKEKGFFLMVEGGRIDHAHHDSWANTALDETIAFDVYRTSGVEVLMYKGHESIDVCRCRNNAMPCLAPGPLSPDT